MKLADIRKQYPQYGDMSDHQLAKALHGKYYRDVPFLEFAGKIGLNAQPDIADEYGPGKAALVAAGRLGDRVVSGIDQALYSIPAAFGNKTARKKLAEMEVKEGEDTKAFAKLEEKHPWATLAGGVAPLLAAPMLGGTALGMAGWSAIPGLIEYGSVGEKLQRGAESFAGSLAGSGLGKLATKALQPFKNSASVAPEAAKDAASRLGVNLRADELTGSRSLGWLSGGLNDLPLSAGMAQRGESARHAAINTAAAKSIGQQADKLSPEVLAKAADDIGHAIRGTVKGEQIDLSKGGFAAGLSSLEKINEARKGFASPAIREVIESARSLGDKIDGDLYQDLRSQIAKQARDAFRANDNSRSHALDRVRKLLDAAADSSLPAEKSAALKAARKQWANLETLERGMVVEGGNVSPARVAAALRQQYDKAFKRGKLSGELPDIAKLGETFKPLPQSGTTPRAIYSALASGQAAINPLGTAVMFAAPPLAQSLLQSGAMKKYLTKGLLDVNPELERALRLSGAGLLGAAASQ